MKAAPLVAFTALLACAPPASQSSSRADPRLGTLVFEDDARATGRVSEFTNAGFSRVGLAVDSKGNRFVLLTQNPGRVFASEQSAPLRSVFVKVSPAGEVTPLPAPALGLALGTAFLAMGEDDETVAAVEFEAGALPGQAPLRLDLFVGGTWTTRVLSRVDLPFGARPTWDSRVDQVRVLGGGVVVVRHDGRLSLHDGRAWREVPAPADAGEVLLGPGDAAGVRVLWTRGDRALATDVLRADGTWSGAPSTGEAFTPSFETATVHGTPDDFTLHYQSGGGMQVVRVRGGAFEALGPRAKLAAEGSPTARFLRTRNPERGVSLERGALAAWVNGQPAGPLGVIPGFDTGRAQVTCERPCGVSSEAREACAECVPRAIRVDASLVDPGLTALHLLLVDAFHDATLRVTVKAFALPTGVMSDVTVPGVAQGELPGGVDAGTVVVTGPLFASGVVLRPGATTHGGTAVTLDVSGAIVQSLTTASDGRFQFAPQDDASQARARIARTGYQPFDAPLPDAGVATVQHVLAHTSAAPTPLNLEGDTLSTGEWFVSFADGGLTLRSQATGLGGGDLGAFDEAGVLVVRGAQERLVTFVPATGQVRLVTNGRLLPAGAHARSVRSHSRGVLFALAAPDGDTELDWSLSEISNATPVPLGRWVDIEQAGRPGCNQTMLWRRAGPGDVRLNLSSCANVSVDTAEESAGPVPVMRHTEANPGGLYGFVGEGCGPEGDWLVSCPLQWVRVPGAGVPRVTAELLSMTAVDVLATTQGTWWLERDGASAALKFHSTTGVVTVVQAGLTLPSANNAAGRPLFGLPNSPRAFLRTVEGLWELDSATPSATLQLPRVVAALPVPNAANQPLTSRAFVLQAAAGQGDCAGNTCTGLLIEGTAMPREVLAGASGNERVMPTGLFTDARTMRCPDDSVCPVLDSVTWAGVRVGLGVGRLVPDLRTAPRRLGTSQARVGGWARLDFPARWVRLSVATAEP